MSCDILPTEKRGPHYLGDVREILNDGWDLMVAHPPCTHLAVSGARWFKDKKHEQAEALDFIRLLLDAPIDKIALENPVGIISRHVRKADQVIQPWQFGHGELKRTCLWLKNLPRLKPTVEMVLREPKVLMASESKTRAKNRAYTYSGIASAMADQWGGSDG